MSEVIGSKARRGPSCAICARDLSAESSVAIGIGPICRGEVKRKYAERGGKDAAGNETPWHPCDISGCLINPAHLPTIIERVRSWVVVIAEAAGEPLPEQAKKLIAISRLRRRIDDLLEGSGLDWEACPDSKRHAHAPAWLNPAIWDLVAWAQFRVEPWLWTRHRDMLDDIVRLYGHLQNLLELIGNADEGQWVADECRNIKRSKSTVYRKRIYRRLEFYPLSAE